MSGAHPAALAVLSLIGTFLLLVACFNYMNIALSTAVRRFKEIGVRKVAGSTRSRLISQFLTENVVLCSIALIFGVGLAHFFFMPAFNNF